MAKLTTDFIKVAQAGPAIDGRTIREEWLRDMAETYNPSSYTAMLWPEHCRWFGNFGEVLELRLAPDEKGVPSLFARVAPNASMLDYNAAGQGLFYSIEVDENFADSGKAYLVGLGVTDSPASLGMPSTRFTAQKGTGCFSNVPFSPLSPAADEAPNWFKKFFPQLFTKPEGAEPEHTEAPAKEDPMPESEERLAALEETVNALSGQITALDSRLAELEVDVAANNGGEPANDDPAYKALAKQLGALRKDFARLSSTPIPGTAAPKNTGTERKGIL